MTSEGLSFQPIPPPISFAGSARSPPSLLVDVCYKAGALYRYENEEHLKDDSTYAILPFRNIFI